MGKTFQVQLKSIGIIYPTRSPVFALKWTVAELRRQKQVVADGRMCCMGISLICLQSNWYCLTKEDQITNNTLSKPTSHNPTLLTPKYLHQMYLIQTWDALAYVTSNLCRSRSTPLPIRGHLHVDLGTCAKGLRLSGNLGSHFILGDNQYHQMAVSILYLWTVDVAIHYYISRVIVVNERIGLIPSIT